MRMIGGSTSARRPCGVSIDTGPLQQRLRFRKKTTLAQEMLAELQQLLPPGFQVYVLFDSWYAANRLLQILPPSGLAGGVCDQVQSEAGRPEALPMAPSAQASAVSARAADRYRRTAADLPGAARSKGSSPRCRLRSVSSSANGTIGINTRSIFCAPTSSLSAQQILTIYQKRWPIEVDNFYVKQHLGLADFRVQSYEATEKWFAIVFLALVFLQWRLNHAHAKERCAFCWPMWCVNIATNMRVPCWRRPVRRRRN